MFNCIIANLEKARKEQREREERERERERERREKERREMERREMERERMLQQQRINESNKFAVARDRSPLRNGTDIDPSRIKEEPKREDELMMRSASVVDPRYHHPSGNYNNNNIFEDSMSDI